MTNDDPFRLAVMKRLTMMFETITIANGYKHDLTGNVFRGRKLFGEGDPLPMISILEAPRPADQIENNTPDNGSGYGPFPLLIQGWVDDDLRNPTDPAYVLEADLRKCVALEKTTNGRSHNLLGFGGKVDKLNLGLGTVRPPVEEVSSNAFFWMFLTLVIAEKIYDPYDY